MENQNNFCGNFDKIEAIFDDARILEANVPRFKNYKPLNSQILPWVPLVLLEMAPGLRIWAVVGRPTEYLIFHHGTEYKNANSTGPKWLEIIPTIWLVFDFLTPPINFYKIAGRLCTS